MIEKGHFEFEEDVQNTQIAPFLKEIRNQETYVLTKDQEETLALLMHVGAEARARLDLAETQDDASELRAVAEEGDLAKHLLILSVSHTVTALAWKYGKGAKKLDVDDLVQEAQLALWQKIDNFDPSKASFSTYANFWIRRAMLRALSDQDKLVRVQTDTQLAINKMRKAQHESGLEGHQTQAIAEVLGVSEERVVELMGYDVQTFSYNIVVNMGKEGRELVELFEGNDDTEEDVMLRLREAAVAEELNRLSDRSRQIITLRFGFTDGVEHTRPEIGQELNLNRERIRQLEVEALAFLRDEASHLKEFL